MSMHMIILGSGVGVRVQAAALQGSHRRGIESTIAVETDRMATISEGIGYVRKVQAEGEMTTTTEAEIGRRTGGRGGDRSETLVTIHHVPEPRAQEKGNIRAGIGCPSLLPAFDNLSVIGVLRIKLMFCRGDLFVTG